MVQLMLISGMILFGKNIGNHMKRKAFQKGVSLVELIIYVAILSIMFGAIVSFVGVNERIKKRNQAVSEVEVQGREAMRIIIQSIKNAQSATVSGSSGNFILTVVSDDVSKNPIVFDLNSGILRIKENVSVPVQLTSSRVIVSNLNFTETGWGSTKGSVKMQFDVTYSDPSGNLNYAKTFYGTANAR